MSDLFFEKYFNSIFTNISQVNTDKLISITKMILNMKLKGGKIIIVGNGGSAAIASHVSVDFTKACKIRTINFNEAR